MSRRERILKSSNAISILCTNSMAVISVSWFALGHSLVEAASAALQPILYELRPDEFDDARVVVAICKVVIQGGETMPLARLFHVSQLGIAKLRMIDVSPVEGRSMHRETGRHSASVRMITLFWPPGNSTRRNADPLRDPARSPACSQFASPFHCRYHRRSSQKSSNRTRCRPSS